MEHKMDWTLFYGERAGTDALLLADFARNARGTRGADLGCGSGAVMLLLLLYGTGRHMTGIDIRESAVEACRENLRRFGLTGRGEAVPADYRRAPFEPGSMDFLVSNPPYFRAGCGAVSPDPERAAQRTETATVAELCTAAARYLKDGGSFYLVHRTEREPEILSALREANLTAVRRCTVFSAPGKTAPIFLLEAVKGVPERDIARESVLLRDRDGRETNEYRKICLWEA